MRVLDLFSGIGGFALGLECAGMEIAAMCEVDAWCRSRLRRHWPEVPIHEDIRDLDGDAVGDGFDLICGGFPCQPWSLAGRRGGSDDDRHLWPEMLRVVGAIRPRWVVGENVPGLDDERFMALDGVLADLEGIGYKAVPLEIPACAVDAPHLRNRVWIVAYVDDARRDIEGRAGEAVSEPGEIERPARCGYGGVADAGGARSSPSEREALQHARWRQEGRAASECSPVGDAEHGRCQIPALSGRAGRKAGGDGRGPDQGHWAGAEWLAGHDGKARRAQPGIRLLAHGVPERVARLKALGNAVVPQMVERIGRAIMEAEAP